ncbi:MAG: hypothetical protein AB1512_16415 [Thermodesulfobacteriota bacterium]
MAAFVLCQRSRPAYKYYRIVEEYAKQLNRPYRFHRIVRHMLDRDALPGMLRHAPTLAWKIVGNDPHIAGMEMRHMSFHDKRGVCRQLMRSSDWRQREVATAVACAAENVPLSEKLPLLSDPNPRVRFRALEAILHCGEQSRLARVMAALSTSSYVGNESSTFTVRFNATDTGAVVFLRDASCRSSERSSFWASSTDYMLVESLDDDVFTLEAIAYINLDAEESRNILNREFNNNPPAWVLDCPLRTLLESTQRFKIGEHVGGEDRAI